jgi:hypothetical protein
MKNVVVFAACKARPRTHSIGISWLLLLICISGCEHKCEPILKSSFSIYATDSLTAAPVTEGLQGTIQSGAFNATLSTHGNFLWYTQKYRPGTYLVRISATHYRTWSRDGVRLRMTADECHIETVHLSVRMVPIQ